MKWLLLTAYGYFISTVLITPAMALPFGAELCQKDKRLRCLQVGNNPDWHTIKRDAELHQLVKRINRVNIRLRGTIAVPKDLTQRHLLYYTPLPKRMPPAGKNIFVVDLKRLAWGPLRPMAIY